MDFIKDNLDYLEYALLIGIAILQIRSFVSSKVKIWKYSIIFKNNYSISEYKSIDSLTDFDLSDGTNENQVQSESNMEFATQIETDSKSNQFNKILKNINSYLAKNKGAIVDFHILKDITDRTVDTDEEEISNKIPAPLYMGLAATMVGIIIGLWGIDFNSEVEDLSLMSPLIAGIKWAMTVSVLGLTLTTWLSIFEFKNGKKKVEEGKNDFLSFLQTELLPDLFKSEDTGVRALNSRLDNFSRSSVGIVKNLDTIVEKTSQSLQKEHQLLNDLKAIDVRRMSDASLKIFKELLPLMDSFKAFPQYYHELNSSLSSTAQLTNKLKEFISRTEDVNMILTGIKEAVTNSSEATSFFNKHIKTFVDYESAVNESIVNADSRMQEALSALKKGVMEQFDSYTELITNYSSKMDVAFEKSISKYVEAADSQISRINDAFESARPNFEKLNKLDKLDYLGNLEKLDKLDSLYGIVSLLENLVQKQNIQTEAIRNLKLHVEGVPLHFPESLTVNQPKSKFERTLNVLRFASYTAILSYGLYILVSWLLNSGIF